MLLTTYYLLLTTYYLLTGALVDYCYTNAQAQKTLKVEASYTYHTLSSDHLPLVVDFRVI